MNRTLVIVKPDGVERKLVGEILARFEARGLRLVAGELRQFDRATAEAHYAEHVGKEFFAPLVEFITRGPSFLAVLEGPEDAWRFVRLMMGPTNPAEAAPGTIRGDYGLSTRENLVHGSDSAESATREIAHFFPNLA